MKKLCILAVFLVAISQFANALGPPWYQCDPTRCFGNCRCPGLIAPGNFPHEDTPQFVLITHDDAITGTANRAVRSVTDGHVNPNGCNVVATWFTTQDGTDCKLAKKLWEQNHEIALHTVHHAQLISTMQNMTGEIMGVKTFLNETCGIPLEDLVGFRSPYLINNPAVRQILYDNQLLYDATINEFVGQDSFYTKSFGQRLYPYTLNNGIPQNCNWTFPDGQCTQDEKYPGLWEVPMWDQPNATVNTEENAFTMDYGAGFGGDVYTTLTTNFDEAYNGNRAPYPIFVHSPWFTPSNIAATNKFIAYALSKPNVYFVTITQLIKWMENPVPASQMNTWLTCDPVDLKPPGPPPTCRNYTIQAGDYIDLIAGKFAVDAKDLVAANPSLTSNNIVPGQTIKIPPLDVTCGGTAPVVAPAAGPSTNPMAKGPATSTTATSQCKIHTVQIGDFLYKLADEFGVDVKDIMAANGLNSNQVNLTPGQTLKIPPYPPCCDNKSCPPAPTDTAATTFPTSEPIPAPTTPSDDRIEMDFVLEGLTANAFEVQGHTQVMNILSELLGVYPDQIILTAAPPKRLRRALLQALTAAPALNVHAVINGDPAVLYPKAQKEINEGEMESLLTALGLSAQAAPTLTAYKGGIQVQDPATLSTATSTTAPATANTTQTTTTAPAPAPAPVAATQTTGITAPVIIGIVMITVLLILAGIVGGWLFVRRRRAAQEGVEKKDQFATNSNGKPGFVGAFASLRIKTTFAKKGDDTSVVIKDENDTPTSATHRNNKVLMTSNSSFKV